MLETSSEKARRVFFFARYEASQLGSKYIEPEHLLLGIFREDKALTNRLVGGIDKQESIRKEIVDRLYLGDKVSSSVDIPMSKRSDAAVAVAEKERIRMADARLETHHLLLGILQVEGLGAETLQSRGITLDSARSTLSQAGSAQSPLLLNRVTACKDCQHLVVDGEPDELRLHLFCAASPRTPQFDCYTGESRTASGRPQDRYKPCVFVNFGNCTLFRSKDA